MPRPTLQGGYADCRDDSLYPDLWPDHGWCPSLGIQGASLRNVAHRRHPPLTLSTGNTWSVNPDPVGPAPQYNGTSHFAQTAAAIDLTDTTVLTLAFWLYWDSFSNNDDLVLESSANFNSNQHGLIINADASDQGGAGYAGINASGAALNSVTYPRPTAAAWHHWAFVLDRGAGAQQVRALYIDGQPVTLTQVATTTTSGTFGSFTWNFMCRNGASLFADGRMGDFLMYKRLLGQAEAVRLYRGEHPLHRRRRGPLYVQSAPPPPPPTGPPPVPAGGGEQAVIALWSQVGLLTP